MAKKKSTAKASTVAATNSGVRRFELVEGASCKFWEVRQNGSEFTVRFGRIGTEGQPSKTKDAGSLEKATAAIEKLIREKTGKGYAEVGSTTKVAGSNAANKTAPASVKEKDKHLLTAEIATRFLRTEEDLDRFKMIEDEAAKIISKYKDDLLLDGLKSLSDVAAESLSKHKGGYLSFMDLTSLSDAAAGSLSKHKGLLSLDGLKSLSDAATISLAMKDELSVSGRVEKQIEQARYKLVATAPREKVLTVAVAKLYPKKLHGQNDQGDCVLSRYLKRTFAR